MIRRDDELILEFPENDQLIFWPEITDDDHYVVVTIVEGTENRNRFWALSDPRSVKARADSASRSRSSTSRVAEFGLVRIDGDTLYLRTDLDAERGRLVSLDLEHVRQTGSTQWREVLAESEDTLVDAVGAGDGFVVTHLVDAQPLLTRLGPGRQRPRADRCGRRRG